MGKKKSIILEQFLPNMGEPTVNDIVGIEDFADVTGLGREQIKTDYSDYAFTCSEKAASDDVSLFYLRDKSSSGEDLVETCTYSSLQGGSKYSVEPTSRFPMVCPTLFLDVDALKAAYSKSSNSPLGKYRLRKNSNGVPTITFENLVFP